LEVQQPTGKEKERGMKRVRDTEQTNPMRDGHGHTHGARASFFHHHPSTNHLGITATCFFSEFFSAEAALAATSQGI
jgi:hypothetical protein